MRMFTIVLYLLLITFGISFAALNAGTLTINLYITQFTTEVSIALLSSFGLGLIMGVGFCVNKIIKLKCELRKKRAQVRVMEKELNNLRVMPLKDQH